MLCRPTRLASAVPDFGEVGPHQNRTLPEANSPHDNGDRMETCGPRFVLEARRFSCCFLSVSKRPDRCVPQLDNEGLAESD
jgi:hypothetical protein